MQTFIAPELDFPVSFKEKEAYELFNLLKIDSSLSLIGPFGMGTSLFLRFITLQAEVKKKYLAKKAPSFILVHLDLNDLADFQTRDLFRLTLRRLYDKLKTEILDQRLLSALQDLNRQAEIAQTPFEIFEALREFLFLVISQANLKPVLIFDPFDYFARQKAAGIFKNLQALRDITKDGVRLIFALKAEPPAVELLSRNVIYLKPLTKKDGRSFALAFGKRVGEDFPPEAIDYFIKISGGHPGLLKDCLRFLLKSKLKKVEESPAFLQKLVSDSAIRTRCEALGRFVNFPCPLFGAYQQTYASQGKGRLSIHPDTNQVIVAGQVLETNLTSQEFRLLAYLVSQPEKICSRDEIVEAVWGKNASAGVSDEAIDKVVQRLRSKVEKDRTQPKYIITIWGRGYQFRP